MLVLVFAECLKSNRPRSHWKIWSFLSSWSTCTPTHCRIHWMHSIYLQENEKKRGGTIYCLQDRKKNKRTILPRYCRLHQTSYKAIQLLKWGERQWWCTACLLLDRFHHHSSERLCSIIVLRDNQGKMPPTSQTTVYWIQKGLRFENIFPQSILWLFSAQSWVLKFDH